MLRLVENLRKKQLAWVRQIMAARNLSHTQLARRAGVDPSTLSKFLNDPNDIKTLTARTEDKLARTASTERPQNNLIPIAGGLREAEAQPWQEQRQQHPLKQAVASLCTNNSGASPWEIKSDILSAAGYLVGDVVIVDQNIRPINSDVVCIQIYDRQGNARTAFRIFEKPFLLTASWHDPVKKPMLADQDNITIMGTVTFTLRPRKSG